MVKAYIFSFFSILPLFLAAQKQPEESGNPLCPITVTIVGDSTLCDGESTTLTAVSNGTAPFTYQWNPSTGLSSTTIQNPVATPATGSVYFVVVTDNNGCTASDNHGISLFSIPPHNITADHTVLCGNDSAIICATGGLTSYSWNVGATSNCVVTSISGNYYVTVTDYNGCTAESNHVSINVWPAPAVQITVNGDTLISFNGITYQWYLNGVPISGADSSIFIPTQGGFYSVEITDTNGCTGISTEVLISGLSELDASYFSVYPNPNENGTWQLIAEDELKGGELRVFDNKGAVVYYSKIYGRNSKIHLDVERGFYLLRIESEKYSLTKKLIRM